MHSDQGRFGGLEQGVTDHLDEKVLMARSQNTQKGVLTAVKNAVTLGTNTNGWLCSGSFELTLLSAPKGKEKMVIVTTVSFSKANMYETGRRMEGFPPVPGYINMMGPYIKNVKFGGVIQTIHLYEFDESRLDEARDFINERLILYNEMADLTYSVDLWLSVEDVLNMTGLDRGQSYASA